jgi:hypothetical protein
MMVMSLDGYPRGVGGRWLHVKAIAQGAAAEIIRREEKNAEEKRIFLWLSLSFVYS